MREYKRGCVVEQGGDRKTPVFTNIHMYNVNIFVLCMYLSTKTNIFEPHHEELAFRFLHT